MAAAAGATVSKGFVFLQQQKRLLDLLASLGINLNASIESLEAMVEEVNIGFVPPQLYPPMLRHCHFHYAVKPARHWRLCKREGSYCAR